MDTDMAQVKDAEERLFESEELYRLIIEHTRDLVRVIDVNFKFTYVSPSHEMLLGYTPDEMMHTSGLDILHPDDKEIALSMHRELVSKDTSLDGLFRFRCKNGQWVTLETRGRSLIKDGRIVGVVTIGRDVTERLRLEKQLKEYQERLEFLAFHDPLTGLPNRSLFFEKTLQAIDEAERNGHGAAIMFIDCDGFKNINDTYGHYVGDEVITELGRRILDSIHGEGMVARLSGDEFTVLLPRVDNTADIVDVAERIMRCTNDSWQAIGDGLNLTVSIGIAAFPSNGEDSKTLLKHADEALYSAKVLGKNTYAFYSPKWQSS